LQNLIIALHFSLAPSLSILALDLLVFYLCPIRKHGIAKGIGKTMGEQGLGGKKVFGILELRRDQVDDLMPTIDEGEVIEEFRAWNDARMDKLEYKGNNVVRALMNIPIFVGTFSILIDFGVLKDMDAYHDERMSDVIFGEPFFREVGINARRFEGVITIYNGNEEVTYQMVWSHPSFKRHTNEQCNKIPPLLKVSEENKMNGIC
ncbi:hypothetical protein Tco_0134421, partial [Tanacetum coccineum]